VSIQQSADSSLPVPIQPSTAALRGRWMWGLGILMIACVAQAVLWTLWWDDPTHFNMSILFVWPAALFALTIWWIFFSGWSWVIRLGSVASVAAMVVGFFCVYRLEWDGGMVPRRVVSRSIPSAEDVARKFLKNQPAVTTEQAASNEETTTASPPPLVAVEGDWPGFRGPRRDGIVQGGSLRRDWETAPPREIWRHPVGRAWSSFAVVGTYAFTQEQRDENECVVAYDFDNGSQLWVHEDKTILAIVDANGGSGPHATPQYDDGLIYSLGGTGILNCLEAATGKPVWSTNILEDAGDGKVPGKPPEWGISGSPLIVDNLVIVIPGGTAKEGEIAYDKGVAAYDKRSGQLVWSHGKHPASYGSPTTETIGGTRQVLVPNGNGLSSHSLENGQEMWFFPLENGPRVNSTSPWKLEDDSLIFGTGYGIGTARIDISGIGGEWKAKQRWFSNRFRPKFNDFVVLDGYLYGLDDGRLACLDVKNGVIKWQSGRYGYGQLLLVDDVLLIISEDGDLLLVPAVPKKSEVLATFKLFNTGFCWNHLALVRGRLLARNANEAVCLDVSLQKEGG